MIAMGAESGELNLMQMSAVREMANIGLGHATTALATMTGRPFNMEIPNVETVAIEDLPFKVGDPTEVAVGISMPIDGDVAGYTAFIFPWSSAQDLWSMLIGQRLEDPSEIDELSASVMLEIGNIVSSAFLNAISDMSELKLHATPPMVSVDFMASITATIVGEAELSDVVALTLETRLYDMNENSTTGYFLCIPTKSGLDLLFERLGIADAA